MAFPYYVSPEQMMQDKAEYAKKGVARGRSLLALEYNHGILLVADNPSSALNKISEIYDNIAFAAAGKYSEFENLRKAGIRHADLKGYVYSREDVTVKSLANAYSQIVGTIFSQEMKPLEVEILVVGIGKREEENEIYRIAFDGSIYDEKGYAAIGGREDALKIALKDRYRTNISLEEVLLLSLDTLRGATNQEISTHHLEAAVLDRARSGRKFRRMTTAEVEGYLAKK